MQNGTFELLHLINTRSDFKEAVLIVPLVILIARLILRFVISDKERIKFTVNSSRRWLKEYYGLDNEKWTLQYFILRMDFIHSLSEPN